MKFVYSLQQLFVDRVFRVPDYQRGFAWEERQITELLEDMETLPAGRDHYTGTLVLHRADNGHEITDDAGTSYSLYDVVDGQQRLTTISILLDRLAAELSAFDEAEALADGTRRMYIAARDPHGTPLYKLTLNDDSRAFFRDAILEAHPVIAGPTIASHSRLIAAKERFSSYLTAKRAELDGGYEAFLRDLHAKITRQLKWTLYEVETSADVGVIFEVMNDRGKALSELDKVKNYLMYVGSKLVDYEHHDLDEDINDAWAMLFSELMAAHLSSSDNEDQLLRVHWLMAYDPQPRKWDGARSIKGRLNLRAYEADHPALLSELSLYAKGLSQASVAFSDARNPSRAGAFNGYGGDPHTRDEIARWNDRLVRLNVMAPFLPLLVATRERYPSDGVPYLELARLAEAFVFRVFTLMRRRADVGQAALFRIGHDLHRGAVEFHQALRQVRATLREICPASTFEEQMRAERNWYEWGGLRFFLYEYERKLASAKGVEPDVPWEELRRRDKSETIEHILPQSPSKAYWSDRFSPEDCLELTHNLGNLTLTKDNSSYGNKSFPDKRGDAASDKTCYAKGAFYIERELAAFEGWTPAQVHDRAERLIQWALARWAFDETDVDEGVELIEDDAAEETDLIDAG
jgi:hypothetical protein